MLKENVPASKFVTVGINITLAIVWIAYALWYARAFRETGTWGFLVFCISETILACLYVFRTAPRRVSIHFVDWIVAVAGTALPLLFSSTGVLIWSGGSVLILIAFVIQIFGLLSLNRSFAVVPAQRVIKTGGLYRFVRHPLYASYLLAFAGYILISISLYNILIIAAATTLLFLRIRLEEKYLLTDATYREYHAQVPWRLVPFVY
ncbi:MAG: isoprenylcysteine carboxyl methyltransferase [Parcubacteria group bacterium Gr01-1014_48]|nr:MAG: isoprenylcysteine carboxyl methyltransferase [Parcubacteria group bacterium Greene0416_14]TSC71960.1 MAG: isoprenylcysteine carboxyl methyltransferase [Parcubacteria group bacterium Gr01-1014_48]TSC99538.1 MAG: isoprenylcysteine carboxyl methyltransferase [Parcubacteria group bacterium Greene1014_15]TSD07039.1 MAG: isoprenylcysteine carboxyl methyltransferase [Parcubacteria group bacterium Greene0714_4]